ncbi:YciI family protein [Gammaproteobacteria bacterium]|nr:YciI family protein [Gammaproteobacteria bacterium]
MKYMLLIYNNPDLQPIPGTAEFKKMMQGYMAVNETYKTDGVYISGDALEATSTATCVRIRNGQRETMDGPFAETKERLGGYYCLNVTDLDAALRYAAMIPTAHVGTIEVRPVRDVS